MLDRLPNWIDSLFTNIIATSGLGFLTFPLWKSCENYIAIFIVFLVVFVLLFFVYFKLGPKEQSPQKIEKTHITNEAHDPDEKNMLVDLQTPWPSPHGLGLVELNNIIAEKEDLAKKLATKDYYSNFIGFHMEAITKYRHMFFAWHKIQQGISSSNGLSLEEFFNVQQADFSLSKNLALEVMRGTQMDYFLPPLKIIEERNAKFGVVFLQRDDQNLESIVITLNYGT